MALMKGKGMGDSVGSFQEFVLLAIQSVGEGAYGVPIINRLREVDPDEHYSVGAVYTTLDRLECRGFITSHTTSPEPIRGGRRKRVFALTDAGYAALEKAAQIRSRLVNTSQNRECSG